VKLDGIYLGVAYAGAATVIKAKDILQDTGSYLKRVKLAFPVAS
jgi:hypothetical protein